MVEFTTGFPDLRFTIEDMIAEKEKVVVSWIISGTLPVTGSKIFVQGIMIHHITNGKGSRFARQMERFGLAEQLGDVSPLRLTATSVS